MKQARRAHQRQPRWRRRAAARPEEIIEAALATFAERGFARSRLDDVAHRAGVTKGTLYLYFDSKEALFREVVKATVGTSIAMGEQFVSEFQGSRRALLEAIIARYWSSLREPANARLVRLALTELGNFPDLLRFYMDEVVHRTERLIASVIKRGIASGEFRSVDPSFVARALQAVCVHLSHAERYPAMGPRGGPRSGDRVAAAIVDLFLSALSGDRRTDRRAAGVTGEANVQARRRAPGASDE